jgi:hypothetical protein
LELAMRRARCVPRNYVIRTHKIALLAEYMRADRGAWWRRRRTEK